MVVQYPDRLVFNQVAEHAARDENSNWLKHTGPVTQIESICRAEVAQGGQRDNVVNSEDGRDINLAWAVYAPATCPEIPIGAALTIYNGEKLKGSGTVKRFDASVFHTRIWL